MSVYRLDIVRTKVSDDQARAVRTAKAAAEYFRKYCFDAASMWRESFWCLAVSAASMPLGHFLVATGGPSAVSVNQKAVLMAAAMSGADGVVLCHNHPSGDPTPGRHDIEMTGDLRKALAAIDVKLLDHLVLADGKAFSFSENIIIKA